MEKYDGSGIDCPPGLSNDRGSKARIWTIGLIFILLIGKTLFLSQVMFPLTIKKNMEHLLVR
jgi:hypothetical protein